MKRYKVSQFVGNKIKRSFELIIAQVLMIFPQFETFIGLAGKMLTENKCAKGQTSSSTTQATRSSRLTKKKNTRALWGLHCQPSVIK